MGGVSHPIAGSSDGKGGIAETLAWKVAKQAAHPSPNNGMACLSHKNASTAKKQAQRVGVKKREASLLGQKTRVRSTSSDRAVGVKNEALFAYTGSREPRSMTGYGAAPQKTEHLSKFYMKSP